MATTTDFVQIMGPLARSFFGEPNKAMSSAGELRYGARGSLSIDLINGQWFDHETNEGGGVLDLVTRETRLTGNDRIDWLSSHGFLEQSKSNGGNGGHAPRAQIVATYDYTDETGALLFQVCRFDPKDFRQRRPDGAGGWTWSVKGVRHVPYRLPGILENQDRVVFVVEGERDVDNLWSLNVPATCNPGGAGKWRDELCEFFRGADVVVVPDRDPQKKHPKTGEPMFHADGRPIMPGQDHAQAVARMLSGVAARVRVLELWKHWPDMPLKGDVSDWIAKGGTADQLYALVERLPDWTPFSTEAPSSSTVKSTVYILPDPKTIPPRGWLYGHHYIRAAVTATVAPGGFGKTTLALYEAITMVSLHKLRVWYISGEDDCDEISRRIAAHCKRYDLTDLGNRLFIDDKNTLPLKIAKSSRAGPEFDQALLAGMEQAIKHNKIDVVIIDPFVAFHLLQENDTAAMDALVKRLAIICTRCQCNIEISHHVRKPGIGQTELTVHDARGAGAIVNAVRSCRVLNQMSVVEAEQCQINVEQRNSYIRIDSGKRNMAPPEKAKWCRLVSVQIANGDNVQAIAQWEFNPRVITESDDQWVQIILRERRQNGLPCYRADIRAGEHWLGSEVAKHFGRTTTIKGDIIWINKQLKHWVNKGVIVKEKRLDDEQRQERLIFDLPDEDGDA